ncbi:hypothetical protein ABFS82_02G127500 [Erythranthe guttata]|uniref:uncharacterized protein LOC105969494 n=1 Tax=Erythranthe guttata TaxID=4155 RepID=UPI00064D809A|nr:PREDICTED: uncharacterized protein LOC105969494 [Erythranthe guttata]|eukprot:XP_012849703.1 PREDICTED: uncharacterized protein LOC105969494 [Erythranthe guttata]
MESRHFSHKHGMVFHQVVQGSEIHCSGCKSAGSGNVYVCWQCNYFLHEHCFRSERSLKHPSHHLHPLTLMPFPTYPSGSFSCNSCNLDGDGFSYSCSECEFDIHVHCALNIPITNPNPHLFHSPVPNPNPNSNPAQNYNPNIYPPPIQSNAYPTYPPQNTVYPPNPNSPYPNFTPPNPITPPIPITQNPAYPPNQNNNPIPADPQPNIVPPYNYVPPPANPDADPLPPPQPTVPTDKSSSELPKELQHKSHPNHKLTLLSEPPEYSLYYNCNACGELIDDFSFACGECDNNFRLHVKCAFLPETVDSKAHEHTLAVRHDTPKPTDGRFYGSVVMCDVCESGITEGYWSYFCKDCNFVTDLQCAFTADGPPAKEEEKNEEEDAYEFPEGATDAEKLMIMNIKAQNQMALLQFQLQMSKNNATFMANMFRY